MNFNQMTNIELVNARADVQDVINGRVGRLHEEINRHYHEISRLDDGESGSGPMSSDGPVQAQIDILHSHIEANESEIATLRGVKS